MSHALARQAIETKLAAWATAKGIGVAYGVESFTPQADQPYLRAFLIPSSTSCRYLGTDALEYRGIYQISVVTPKGQPQSVPEGLIAELNAVLPLDSFLDQGKFAGQVVEALAQGPTIPENTVYTIPATLTYQGSAPK
ncbi:phage tail terminator-like protein [Pseudomonas rhizoryzae]|uniref:phage tail terminator-like protein n=1 Tax=Pseudomonas rhizoryzae TaxID=2571129 RepID=UPI0010C1650C|nr:phage tail terminator-like protein [Pseudomonas rhizoryzae]